MKRLYSLPQNKHLVFSTERKKLCVCVCVCFAVVFTLLDAIYPRMSL